MKRLLFILSGAVVTVVLSLEGQAPTAPAQSVNSAPPTAETEKAFFTQYCQGCHSQAAKARGMNSAEHLTIDNLDTAHIEKDPEIWERVVRKLRAGMMPPSGM